VAESEDWRTPLAETGELQPAVVDTILSIHGDRGQRAIEAVSESRVKAYRDFTVVVGYGRNRVQAHFGPTYKNVPLTYVTQEQQLGSGHALLAAESASDSRPRSRSRPAGSGPVASS
jgi:UTP-glucose-1-phosphate uridylyltransferase